ncbi:unnamed protein product [Triticum turgidum subsp. durum]|uniref:XS domain-containing protein n=1 Tax=Triticum turgidum subsp. durum TaxID=4567 RepID=A0A9R0PUU4_TRITD|nr:unnamed protein product [Triticum turgidum subsp. durum]
MSGSRRGGGPPGNGGNPGPGGGWETIENKKKKWAPRTSSSNAPPATARQAWNGNGPSRPSGSNFAQPSGRGPAARGNPRASSQTRSTELGLQAPNPAVTPPLVNGWQWASRPRPVDQIHERQSHCPACQNGPGAIAWFKGLESLVRHARTMGSRRVKLHRELAALLEEEISHRGSSVVQPGEHFGKWNGLTESTDRQIVWPPMVIVMNTRLEKGEDDKWLGMGNQELLEYFSTYAVTKARHAYGPVGHRGMSVLIFESSAVGYIEAERLDKRFVDQRTHRDNYMQKHRALFLPGGIRQLYGFLATKEDMEDFNKHHQGKSRLKYEMRSHNEMVVAPMKKMSEDNQQLTYVKNKGVKTEQRSKVVQGTLDVVAQKLRETEEENIFVRRKAKEKHSEYEEEMKSQEKFFLDQIENIHKALEDKEREFERLLQEERAKARQCDVDSGTTENRRLRKEQVQRFMYCQVKDVQEFEAEADQLIKAHEEKKVQLKKEYAAKEVELEKEFDAAFTGLMEKHKPNTFQASNSS